MMDTAPAPAPAGQPARPHSRRTAPDLERVRGKISLGARADGGVTRLVRNYQEGAGKVRFPRRAAEAPLEAVVINTAGGLTGGDRFAVSVALDQGARAVVTTQAAERIYRRAAGHAAIATDIMVGPGGALDWLPQETIVFDRSAFRRTLDADVDPAGRLLAIEAIVLGRTAMGERAENVAVSDNWRVRRGGELIFADGLRLDGDAPAILAGGATGAGAAALATLVLVAADAGTHVEAARGALAACAGEAGVSAWNGMLVARLLAPTGQALRAGLVGLVECLRDEPMPRVWAC